jgi:hypothetical protein
MSKRLALLRRVVLQALDESPALSAREVRHQTGLSAVEVAVGLGILLRDGRVACDPGQQVWHRTGPPVRPNRAEGDCGCSQGGSAS